MHINLNIFDPHSSLPSLKTTLTLPEWLSKTKMEISQFTQGGYIFIPDALFVFFVS